MMTPAEALEEIRKIIFIYNHECRDGSDEMDWLAAAETVIDDVEDILDNTDAEAYAEEFDE